MISTGVSVRRDSSRWRRQGLDTMIEAMRTPHGEARPIRHASLPEAVHDELRRRILNNEFAAGERLLESKIAEEFGVSRTTLRGRRRPGPQTPKTGRSPTPPSRPGNAIRFRRLPHRRSHALLRRLGAYATGFCRPGQRPLPVACPCVRQQSSPRPRSGSMERARPSHWAASGPAWGRRSALEPGDRRAPPFFATHQTPRW